ncbi:MAG: hypothetical protein N2C14_29195 [Planctomycetales bacterium]
MKHDQPPSGSSISVENTFEGRVLSWMNPTGGAARYFGAAFLMFWLCGWAVGEIGVICVLGFGGLAMINGDVGLEGLFIGAFLAFWLTGWTFGGFFAIRSLWALLSPPRPEQLTLGYSQLIHDPGTQSMIHMGRHSRSSWEYRDEMRHPPKKRDVPKHDVGKINLDFAGDRQRLTVDVGTDRFEIGRSLREPEREWLAEVLRDWLGK